MYRPNLFSVGVAAMVLFGAIGMSRTASAELVAAYSFDEGSGTTLHNLGTAGSVLNGNISGASWSGGTHGGALSFNGTSDYAVVADNAALNFTSAQSFTAMAWVYIDPTQQSPPTWHTMFVHGRDKAALTETSNMWGSFDNTDSGDRATFSGANNSWLSLYGSASTGAWHNIAIVQDVASNKELLYVDGSVVATQDGTANHNDGGSLYFGAWLDGSTFHEGFTGKLDDFRLYNTALSANAITTAMASAVPEPSTLMLLTACLFSLLAYAWRKRK